MKKFKKIMAVLVAAMMIMATMVPAFADPTTGVPGTHTLHYIVAGNGGVEADVTDVANNEGKITLDFKGAQTPPTHADDPEGYKIVFIGWTETQNEHIYKKGETLTQDVDFWTTSKEIELTGTKYVYALWGYDFDRQNGADVLQTEAATYTVEYDDTNGTPVPGTVSVPAGTYYIAGTTFPRLDGYKFMGWTPNAAPTPIPKTAVSSDVDSDLATKPCYQPGASYQVATNTTFYPAWAQNEDGDEHADYTENKYTVTYDVNAAASKEDVIRTILTSSDTTFAGTDFEANPDAYLATVDDIVDGYDYTLLKVKSPAGTKVKYNVSNKEAYVGFIGWTTDKDASYKIYKAGEPINGLLTHETIDTSTDPRTYYAVWGYDNDHDGIPNYNLDQNPDQTLTGASIVIDPAKENEKYYAYRMLKLTVDDTTNPTAYAYTVDEDWVEFFLTESNWNTVFKKVNGVYFASDEASDTADGKLTWSSSSKLSAFAEKAAAYAKANGIKPDTNPNGILGVKNAGTGNVTANLQVNESGYYLLTSTLGTRAMIKTMPNTATSVKEKNEVNSVAKTVQEDSTSAWGSSNDAQIGDKVDFRSEATIVPRSVNIVIHDQMDEGFTLIPESIKIYTTDDYSSTEYTSAKVTTAVGNDDFQISIPDSFAKDITADTKLYIAYSAYLNKAAVNTTSGTGEAVAVKNNIWFSSGAASLSIKAETKTYTRKFQVKKVKKGDANAAYLKDAVFMLLKNSVPVKLVKISANVYRVADGDDTTGHDAVSHVDRSGGNRTGEVATIDPNTLVEDFVTVASGNIVIWGVDSDKDYTLKEIQAPKGYILPTTVVEVEKTNGVSTTNETLVTIENETTSALPETGGMGTTVLYIVGGMLVILAGAYLFFSRKRTA